MIIKIDGNFAEHGLTLEEAFVLARVQYYKENKAPCIESNLTIAKAMGKSESTARRSIESLIEKGYLKREIVKKTRILYINDVNNEQIAELEEETPSINELPLEEKVQRMQEALQMNKDPNYDSTEELY